ncbi:hypothetical protein BI49514_01691 [Brevibacterium iodinum ATCC 49514]|uniref:Uncharacterized protein n=1 Tax=Brevibacterium iodinum ATCC 49514 TaxID=1255616 RepID=A0A2H1J6J5_9MICO|nr:hypothetical protein [Brevibacterium iodinum]SMX83135.1 hypothetical protein BI49514_01691 [Brevibacterium iodinum ATCC 49514]SUW14251.1 Uncharacterised protein [Brevibacterium iodinum]
MAELRYSINVTVDGCCDHRVGVVSDDFHLHHANNFKRADGLTFGRITYLFAGLSDVVDLEPVDRSELEAGHAIQTYRPKDLASR